MLPTYQYESYIRECDGRLFDRYPKKGTKILLTISGSDTSSCAGIQADLKAFAAHGCYGVTVITALTAQNTTDVQGGIHPCTPEFVANQIRSVLDSNRNTPILLQAWGDDAAANLRSSLHLQTLLGQDAIEFMVTRLFPMAALITPNKAEAELLLAQQGIFQKIETLDDMLIAVELLLRSVRGDAVLLKGGHVTATMRDVIIMSAKKPDIRIVKHGPYGDNMEILLASHQNYSQSELVIDILHQTSGEKTLFVHPRINPSSTHGARCTLSSAIACEIALGCKLKEAVTKAIAYTHLGIEVARPLGKGHGRIDHFHSISPLLTPRRTPTSPFPLTHLLIQSASSIWKQYVEHDFVKQLGQGTLNRSSFVHYIKQDYLYLKYYARAYAQVILNILHGIGTHKSFCTTFGVTPEELENTPESTATTAYGAYLIDVGLRGDTTTLTIALMACLLGYGEVGLWLQKESKSENKKVVKEGLETIENCAVADPPSSERLAEWVGVWERCTKLEKGFWDMGLGNL